MTARAVSARSGNVMTVTPSWTDTIAVRMLDGQALKG
ncbi:hypothetical protein FHU36_002038 [Nonomuraea muscovyensis]|uniref:Uncharacterized protein n=1 Tax=Nonomuraea muscovyensis TaxID=1124761 RepID=A0A7X0EXM7_9ACTN|nr:hypothetical protein [Nonomuraea muscovyensis]